MKLKTLAAIAAVVLAAVSARAFLGGLVINSTYAVTQVLPIPLGSGVQSLSASVNYSSPTFQATTFTTGQVSTGSIVVVNNTKLSTGTATDSIVVNSTSGALGDFVSMSFPTPPGAAVVKVNRDWIYGPNTSSAAINLAAALRRFSAQLGGVNFVASGNVVYATAPVGGLYNRISVVTNNPATLTVSSATFLGGRDSAVVSVNGTNFKANLNYTVGVSSNTSAANLATAINTKLSSLVTATNVAGDNTVSLVSKKAGATYALATSNSAAATVSAAATYGAQTPSWTLNGTTIKIVNHGYVTGLKVAYSSGTSPSIVGLSSTTAYYVGVVDANDVGLATSSARAAAGQYVTLGSTSTLTAAKTYSLTPSAFSAGSAGFAWDVSNDGTNWFALANTSSVTYTSPGSSVFSFGALPYRYMGVSFTAPAAGAITLQVNAQGQ